MMGCTYSTYKWVCIKNFNLKLTITTKLTKGMDQLNIRSIGRKFLAIFAPALHSKFDFFQGQLYFIFPPSKFNKIKYHPYPSSIK